MEKKDPNLIFNYENIFYSFYYDDEGACIHRSREFALNYVCSGEMVLDTGGSRIHAGKGECVFIPRDHHITMYKRPLGGERYCGIFMSFTRSFLKEMYSRYAQGKFPADTPKLESGVIKLPDTAEFRSLFSSLSPFLDPEVRPRPDFMQLKLQEGLLALLHTDRRFAPTLFDFNEPWKIDILDFMNRNYMYEFSLEDLARYTGRSQHYHPFGTFGLQTAQKSGLTCTGFSRKKKMCPRAYHKLPGKSKFRILFHIHYIYCLSGISGQTPDHKAQR